MNRFLFSCCVCLCILTLGAANGNAWTVLSTQENPSATDIINFYDVCFASAQKGWAVGVSSSYGVIYVTEDGGKTWNLQIKTALFDQLLGVVFLNESNGWAAGIASLSKKEVLLHTTDGGATWNSVSTGLTKGLNKMFFLDENHGWLTGGSIMVATSDGGATWESQTPPTTKSFLDVCFIDENTGWAVGNGTGIMHTGDGGKTWSEQGSSSSAYIWGVHFVDANNGWIVGGGGYLGRTTDGGATWIINDLKDHIDFKDVYFTDALNGWAVGGRSGGNVGGIYITSDGGVTWTKQEIDTTRDLEGICAYGGTVWACGYYGTILSESAGGVFVDEESKPVAISLAQNSPNPFNPSTTISFTLTDGGFTRLAVYNLAGQIVATLIEGAIEPGHHAISWDGTDKAGMTVSSGVYLYRLDTGNSSLTRKMLLVR
ncbi:YCF48-related protein [bacterium]|nr:YCF48-related protein [bacterium]